MAMPEKSASSRLKLRQSFSVKKAPHRKGTGAGDQTRPLTDQPKPYGACFTRVRSGGVSVRLALNRQVCRGFSVRDNLLCFFLLEEQQRKICCDQASDAQTSGQAE